MKNQSTLFLIAFVACAIVGIIILQTNMEKRDSKAQFTIGILQTTSHPALDMAKEGFMKTISAELSGTADFVCRNALGSIDKLEHYAREYHENKTVNAIFALGTPAAQAIANIEKDKPIIIAAVTDPHELGLIYKHTNVTGSSDMTDPKYQINYLKQLMPQVKTVAIMYTATELNSSIVAKKMIEALLHAGLNPLEIAFDAESTLLASIDNALTNADVLFIPTDNTLSSMIQTIAQRAHKSKKPVWVCDNTLVAHQSILASYGIDYETNGIQAARAAIAVLTENKKPYEIAVTHAPKDILLINKKTLRELQLKVPVELEPWAKLV
ncbi:peptide ABC transporter substrate-binding protein [Candidatus Dependentiae bacterium Noda2021]|nr:peptide ABC transporter substrate-binding protein [Candidatus Dependentiae bacterium Noda2021]